jgi:hypothetical protein
VFRDKLLKPILIESIRKNMPEPEEEIHLSLNDYVLGYFCLTGYYSLAGFYKKFYSEQEKFSQIQLEFDISNFDPANKSSYPKCSALERELQALMKDNLIGFGDSANNGKIIVCHQEALRRGKKLLERHPELFSELETILYSKELNPVTP